MPVLTGIDVLGIQRYIFASNLLRDVLAASWTVERITGVDFLEETGADRQAILLAAGGNAVLEFHSMEEARRWTSRYARALYDEAPGLEVAVVHRPYREGALAEAFQQLQEDLAREKLSRYPDASQLGLSVTARCAVTGSPATGSEAGEPLSRQILALRRKQDEARKRWRRFLPQAPVTWLESCEPTSDDLRALALKALATRHRGLLQNRGGHLRIILDGDAAQTRALAGGREVKQWTHPPRSSIFRIGWRRARPRS